MEGSPQQTTTSNERFETDSKEKYDANEVLAAAQVELEERLLTIEIREHVPEGFALVVQLEAVATSITDSADRHVLKAAGLALTEAYNAMPHGEYLAFEQWKMKQAVYGAANNNPVPTESIAA